MPRLPKRRRVGERSPDTGTHYVPERKPLVKRKVAVDQTVVDAARKAGVEFSEEAFRAIPAKKRKK
jgi:hypothetical protein